MNRKWRSLSGRTGSHRVVCEGLEPRRLLASFVWDGAADSNGDGAADGDGVSWFDGLNWRLVAGSAPVGFPTAGDDASLGGATVVGDEIIVGNVVGGHVVTNKLMAGSASNLSLQFVGRGTASFIGSAGLTLVTSTEAVGLSADSINVRAADVGGSLTITAGRSLFAGTVNGTNDEFDVGGVFSVTAPEIGLSRTIRAGLGVRIAGTMSSLFTGSLVLETPRLDVLQGSVIGLSGGGSFAVSGDVHSDGEVELPTFSSVGGTYYNRAGGVLYADFTGHLVNEGTFYAQGRGRGSSGTGLSVRNRGVVVIDNAALRTAAFEQEAAGVVRVTGQGVRAVNVVLGGGSEVARPAVLGGTLELSLAPGQDPAPGTRWVVVESDRSWGGARVGTFDRFLPRGTPSGHNLRLHYTPWGAEVEVVDAAPAVVASGFVENGASPAVVVRFDEVVVGLTAGDLVLTDRATGQAVSTAGVGVAFDPATQAATVSFPPGLADGNYRLTLPAGSVADVRGNATAAELAVEFYVLAGDANRDRRVDFNDLVRLAQNYNRAGGVTFGTGDFNYDGRVDFNDLVLLAQRYNTTLAPPAAVAVAAGGAARSAGAALAASGGAGASPAGAGKVFSTAPVVVARPKVVAKAVRPGLRR